MFKTMLVLFTCGGLLGCAAKKHESKHLQEGVKYHAHVRRTDCKDLPDGTIFCKNVVLDPETLDAKR
jgi:hypothetical protein